MPQKLLFGRAYLEERRQPRALVGDDLRIALGFHIPGPNLGRGFRRQRRR
jgi:hypothetical protein